MSPICLFLSLAPAVWLSLSFCLSGVNWMDFYCHPHSFCLISWLIVLVSVSLCVAVRCCSIFLPIFLSHSPSLHLADDDINESTFTWQYISYHIASTMGLGIIYWCIKLVSLTAHHWRCKSRTSVRKSIYKVHLHTAQKHWPNWGHVCNKHTKRHPRICTNTRINKVYTPMLKKCHGYVHEIGNRDISFHFWNFGLSR